MRFMKKQRIEVAVVGGGAAGLMAAIHAASAGAETVLFERGAQMGRKLRITGKGRCNVTNNCSVEQVLRSVPRNARFLYSAMNAFPPSEVMTYFEGLGVPLKTERGNRVFPASDRAADIVEALEREARRQGVRVERQRITGLRLKDGAVDALLSGERSFPCHTAILCTGGLSYPKTGSDGDGFRMAARLGHRITEPQPSLVPLTSEDPDCAAMQGLSLRNVTLSLLDEQGKVLWSELGEMQFTHFGVTGPLVLSASAHRKPGESCLIELDLKPALDEQKLDLRLQRLFQENRNRDFKNAMGDLLPRLMEPVMVRRSGIPPETKVHEITREQRAALLRQLKHFRIAVSGTRPIDEAIITAGGVSVKEIWPATMASRLVNGLYLAGELLDVDAYTGGYNLQIAWATGRAAGLAAASEALQRNTTEGAEDV